ncbi:hypothetical protein QZM67_01535 [Burkholderia sp. AU45251]|nr:hypothetical protein [Burkholderia sp. AU45251]
MAESAEHLFLKQTFLTVLKRFSRIDLYGFCETDRKLFDFSCLVERDWERPLVGQVLWGHTDGIEKDVRSLLHDDGAEITPYIVRDSVKTYQALEEIIASYRNSPARGRLARLKLLPVPSDFDADNASQRDCVERLLTEKIVDDIIFNVVFGHIAEEHVQFFLDASGTLGLNLAILYVIATEGFLNISTLSKRLQVSASPVREQLLLLKGAGFIRADRDKALYEMTSRGRLFLDLVRRVDHELETGDLTDECAYILSRLGCAPIALDERLEARMQNPFGRLLTTMQAVRSQFGCDLSSIRHVARHRDVPE